MTTMSFRARPRWWDRERVQYYLDTLDSVAWVRELGDSIAPPRYGRYGDRKEIGFSIAFKNKKQKKEFMELGLIKLYLSELEKICRNRFVIELDYHKKYEIEAKQAA
jgi:hypothetical protein